MKLETHWTVRDPIDKTRAQRRADVLQQVYEWADAEPNVTACRVLKATPVTEMGFWWTATLDLTFREEPEQESLWGAA